MISFERSFDYGQIKSIITHQRIYPFVSDDFSPAPADYRPLESEKVWHVLVKDDAEVLGLWILVPENEICWKIHTCLLPNSWGERAKQAAKLLAKWIWENTPCLRVITDVPEYNRVALKFAKEAGLAEFGVNEESFMKNGELHDQIMLGISKPKAGAL